MQSSVSRWNWHAPKHRCFLCSVDKEAACRKARRSDDISKSLQTKLTAAKAEIASMKQQEEENSKKVRLLQSQITALRNKLEAKHQELKRVEAALIRAADGRREERVIAARDETMKGLKKRLDEAAIESMEMVQRLEDEQRALASSKKKFEDLTKRNVTLVNRSKNRGRAIEKLKKKAKAKSNDEDWFKLPKRRLKENVTRVQLARRRKIHEQNLTEAHRRSSQAWGVEVKGCGLIELVSEEQDGELRPSIKVKKGSTMSARMKQCMALHDNGCSKKKMHEQRMMLGGAHVPSLQAIGKCQEELNDEILSSVDVQADANSFVCSFYDILTCVVGHRGLHAEDTLHILMEGDGRGTGKSVHTCTINFRVLNEGRLIHRQDRAHLLALLVGKEKCDLVKSTCSRLLKELEDVQAGGTTVELPDGSHKDIKVVLCSMGDAKWQAMMHGMVSFISSGSCCLFCKQERKKFAANIEVCHEMDPERFNNSRLGVFGRKQPDMLPFTPTNRRFLENMHLLMRWGFDELVVSGWNDIIWNEHGDEGPGMACVQEQMIGDDINMPNFKFDFADKHAGNEKQEKLVWTRTPAGKIPMILKKFDFVSGYKLNPNRGRTLQETCRKFMRMHQELQNWPGDGPDLSAEEMFRAHAELVRNIIGGDPEQKDDEGDDFALPGEDAHQAEDEAQPLTTVTPYCHMFVNHSGQQHQKSREFARFFVPRLVENTDDDPGDHFPADFKQNGGGLKFARTESLERSNLIFFHDYFQTLDRRPASLVRRAGLQMLRQMFNPEKLDRSKHFCMWCGRGFVHRKPFEAHQNVKCSNRPPMFENWENESECAASRRRHENCDCDLCVACGLDVKHD